MKAAERIRRYGLEKYLKTCRKTQITDEWIEVYEEKYAAEFDIDFGQSIPTGKVVKYNKTMWHIEMQRGDEHWSGDVPSALHKKRDLARDLNEAFYNAQKATEGSGWALCEEKCRYLGMLKSRYINQGDWKEHKAKSLTHRIYTPPTTHATLTPPTETLQQKRYSVGKALKDLGYSVTEIAKAMMEV